MSSELLFALTCSFMIIVAPRTLYPTLSSGKQIDAENATNFQTNLGSVFTHSLVAKLEFKKATGRT